MKLSKLYFLTVIGLALAMGVTGCKRKPTRLTDIPGRTKTVPTDAAPAPPVVSEAPGGTKSGSGSGTLTLPPIGPGPTVPLDPPVRPAPLPVPMPPDTIAKNPDGTIPTGDLMDLYDGKYKKDRDFFKLNTVFFDFDRATVRAGERVKVEEVALYLKGDAKVKLLVEGHCDERGTEEYNRALGERRALSLREYLANLGIAADRIHTISYGEDQPAVPGHNEAAWGKNRRGEFVLLKPVQ